jgi:hypothetical protein
MKRSWALAATILAATATAGWAQDDDDGDGETPAATAAPVAGGRTLTLGFAGLMDRANRTDLDPINLTAGALNSGAPYDLQSGGYYRIDIVADGTQEIAIEGPGFFRNVWVNEIVIEDLEVRPLGVDSIEFDEAGTVSMSFVAITPGQYDIRIRGTTGETQRADFVIQ